MTDINQRVLDRYRKLEWVTVFSNIYTTPETESSFKSTAGNQTYTLRYSFPADMGGQTLLNITPAAIDLNISAKSASALDSALRTISKDSIFNSVDMPERLYVRNNEVGFPLAGLRYTLTPGGLLSDHTGIISPTLESLSERSINTFAKKVIDTDIEKLPIIVNSTNITEGSATLTTETQDLNEYILGRPELRRIYDYLKFTLSATPGDTALDVNLLPDIVATLPGPDIPASGTYLFSIDRDTHVFCAEHSGLYTLSLIHI